MRARTGQAQDLLKMSCDTMPSAPSLAIVCASHIAATQAGSKRMGNLMDTVESWSIQTLPIPMYLSISFEPGLATFVERGLEDLEKRFGPSARPDAPLYVFRRKQRFSQFEHYALLAKEAPGGLDHKFTWVMFSDDDDLMHERRAEVHRAAILAAISSSEAPALLAFVAMPTGAISANDANFGLTSGRGGAHKRQAEISAQIEAHKMELARYGDGGRTDEYHFYAVPLHVLRGFTSSAAQKLLQHRYADCFFLKFLNRGDPGKWGRFTHNDTSDKIWYYAALATEHDDHSGAGISNAELPNSVANLRVVQRICAVPGGDHLMAQFVNNMEWFLAVHNGPPDDRRALLDAFAGDHYGQALGVTLRRCRISLDDFAAVWECVHFKPLLAAPIMANMHSCGSCGAMAASRCLRCKRAWFCDKGCLEAAWKAGHKAECAAE